MTKLEELINEIEQLKDRLLAVVVHLNDTYLIEERSEQNLPGFPRTIATVNRIKGHVEDILGEDRTLVVHSGDFLGPSLLGKNDKGESMVELLNRLGLNYCTLGNHEFDYDEESLIKRMDEAHFQVLLSNVTTDSSITLKPYALWPNEEDPLIALTGIVSETVYKGFAPGWKFISPKIKLFEFLDETKNVPFRIILSHATREEDNKIRQTISSAKRRGIWDRIPPYRSYILGGHDHDIDWIEGINRTIEIDEREINLLFGEEYSTIPLMKNLSNLQTVRVLLLLAGGAGEIRRIIDDEALKVVINNELSRKKNNWILETADSEANWRSRAKRLTRYPEDLDTLLNDIHPRDASEFRKFFNSEEFRNKWATLPNEEFDFDREYTLAAAFNLLTAKPDILPFILRHEDHENTIANDVNVNYVKDKLKTIEKPDDNDIVCDFSDDKLEKFDANDISIRRMQTNFGFFVAECVRRKGNADVAILNSGAFRSDSTLPLKLRKRNLREVFKYDPDDSIIVLELPQEAVNLILKHGLESESTGAYPQFAPTKIPDKSTFRVAIVFFLIYDNEDGYAQKLANLFGVETIERLCSEIIPEIKLPPSFSIKEAVLEHAKEVGYPEMEVGSQDLQSILRVPERHFISLANSFLELVGDWIKTVDINDASELASDNDIIHDLVRYSEESMYIIMLRSMKVLPNQELQFAREKLQNFVGQLLKDRTEYSINTLKEGAKEFNKVDKEPALFNPALQMEEFQMESLAIIFHKSYVMRDFRRRLQLHADTFRYRTSYSEIFKDVLEGFPSVFPDDKYLKFYYLKDL